MRLETRKNFQVRLGNSTYCRDAVGKTSHENSLLETQERTHSGSQFRAADKFSEVDEACQLHFYVRNMLVPCKTYVNHHDQKYVLWMKRYWLSLDKYRVFGRTSRES